ncbi:MAG: proline racemase family protein [Candidatus Rokubacteria bacterium]|nr:proline racemase family protein [Candidatus Rokubacteria bacterium]
MRVRRLLSVVDYHTEGEPMRIVVGGAPAIPGATPLARSDFVDRNLRDLLGFVLYEPRGHRAMCGAILTEPISPEAQAGVIFIEPSGCVHMCGHGAIAIASMLVEMGRVVACEPTTELTLETAAGLVRCRVAVEGGEAVSATFQNVPAFACLTDAKVEVSGLGTVPFDLAYGGHFYAMVPASAVGLSLTPADAERIVEVGEAIRLQIEREVPLVHPEQPQARGLLYVQFFEPAVRAGVNFKNTVVVSPLGLDRSPCGTGTSARMASLHARGELALMEPFVHESILGTLFTGRVVAISQVGPYPAVVPEITGRAFLTGLATLVLEPDDPFPGGFLL